MALDQSALIEVLDALTAAEVDDRIRQAAQTIDQALIEAELTAVIGATPYEPTPERSAQRNGHRQRLLVTTAGDLELRMPIAPGSWGVRAGRHLSLACNDARGYCSAIALD